MQDQSTHRVFQLSYLRTLVTLLVVAHHSALAYLPFNPPNHEFGSLLWWAAILERDRPFHFSGRRLEINNDIWPATGGSIFASTITTYPGTGHISRSPFIPIEPPLWP